MLEQRKNSDVIRQLLDLAGKRVVDVGCGSGGVVRLMTREGAHVIGIECNPRQLAKANAAEKAGDERYLEGWGEALPLDDDSVDIVVYFNSLHHVPVDKHDQALLEAARVLVPDGLLYITEPVAAGAHFEMMQPIDDETCVRAEALKAIGRATGTLFEAISEENYFYQVIDASYEAFAEDMTRIDASRDELFRTRDAELRQRFYDYGIKQPDGRYAFEQPMRVNLLARKPPRQ